MPISKNNDSKIYALFEYRGEGQIKAYEIDGEVGCVKYSNFDDEDGTPNFNVQSYTVAAVSEAFKGCKDKDGNNVNPVKQIICTGTRRIKKLNYYFYYVKLDMDMGEAEKLLGGLKPAGERPDKLATKFYNKYLKRVRKKNRNARLSAFGKILLSFFFQVAIALAVIALSVISAFSGNSTTWALIAAIIVILLPYIPSVFAARKQYKKYAKNIAGVEELTTPSKKENKKEMYEYISGKSDTKKDDGKTDDSKDGKKENKQDNKEENQTANEAVKPKKHVTKKYENFDVVDFGDDAFMVPKFENDGRKNFSDGITNATIYIGKKELKHAGLTCRLRGYRLQYKYNLSDDSRDVISCVVADKLKNNKFIFDNALLGVADDIGTTGIKQVTLKPVSYFGYISNDELCFKGYIKRTDPRYLLTGKAVCINRNTGAFYDFYGSPLTNLVGINLLILVRIKGCEAGKFNYALCNVQGNTVDVNGGSTVASASGSLEIADLKKSHYKKYRYRDDAEDYKFGDLLMTGMLRELFEESRITAAELKKYAPTYKFIGYTRLLSKGGKPDFFATATVELDSIEKFKEFKNAIFENYTKAQNKDLGKDVVLENNFSKFLPYDEFVNGDCVNSFSPQLQYMRSVLIAAPEESDKQDPAKKQA